MFDHYTTRRVTERVTENVNITEKRAPTDESVRLLMEMEKAAKEKILKSIKLDANHIKGQFILSHDHHNLYETIMFHFVLNGKEVRAEYTPKSLSGDRYADEQTILQGIVDEVARQIAITALTDLKDLFQTIKFAAS